MRPSRPRPGCPWREEGDDGRALPVGERKGKEKRKRKNGPVTGRKEREEGKEKMGQRGKKRGKGNWTGVG